MAGWLAGWLTRRPSEQTCRLCSPLSVEAGQAALCERRCTGEGAVRAGGARLARALPDTTAGTA